jgi:copper chaperone CopZ
MKIATLLAAACCVAAAPMPAWAAPPAQKAAPVTAPFAADVHVSVNGLVCDFCAQAISHNLRNRAEVKDVRVDLTAKVVAIAFKPGQSLDDPTIRKLITASGYSVTQIHRVAAKP